MQHEQADHNAIKINNYFYFNVFLNDAFTFNNNTHPKGRPRVRREDDVRNDLRKMGVNNSKQTTQ